MQQFNNQITLSMHLMTLKLNAILTINNHQQTFDRFMIECSNLIIKQFRQCIWLHRDQMQLHWQQTISSMHLILSRSSAAIWTSTAFYLTAMSLNATYWHQNNFVSAFDDISIKCSSFDIIFNCQCIWWHRHQMQSWQFHQQTIVSVHLIVKQSNATVLTSHLIVNAFNDIDIKCSIFDINNLSVHNSITTSHSFNQFFYFIERSLIGLHTHSFDQIFF